MPITAILEVNGKTYHGAVTPKTIECVEELADNGFSAVLNGAIQRQKVTDMLTLATCFIYSYEAQQVFTKTKFWPPVNRDVLLLQRNELATAWGLDNPGTMMNQWDLINKVLMFVLDLYSQSVPVPAADGETKNAETPPTDGGPTSKTSDTDSSD